MAKQTFTTGQVLTAAQMTSLQQTAMGGGSATAKTASYVLVAADAGTTVIMNSGSATTITVNTALFAAGDTVFIVNQGAGVCTITAGTATVSTAGSLAMSANETGQLYFLSSSAAIFSEYTQASGGGGKVLQVVFASTATVASSSSSTYADTGLTATITPSSATSKVLVIYSQNGVQKEATNASCRLGLKLLRGATVIQTAGELFLFTNTALTVYGTSVANTYLDEPATTSATTYKTTFASTDNNAAVNVQANGIHRSSITLLEIGA